MQIHRMSAKDRVIDFVTTTDMNGSYEFLYAGSLEQAESFVHQMRVALSRLREKVEQRGRKRKIFKMLKTIESTDEEGMQKIVLKMAGQLEQEIDEKLSDVLDKISR